MQRRSFLLSSLGPLLYVGTGLPVACGADAPARSASGSVTAILPLQSAAVGRQADAVRLGILEAARVGGETSPAVDVVSSGDEPADALAAYARAVRAGARLVIGPLGRRAVAALAQLRPLPVPVIALNQPEREGPLAEGFYTFGRQIEQEARQVADFALAQGRQRCRILQGEGTLLPRLAQAFAERWLQGGGEILEHLPQPADLAAMARLRDRLEALPGDALFLALEAEAARAVRAFLPKGLATCATSLVHTSTESLANFELEGVQFVDMPWLLDPDHPGVLAHQRTLATASPEPQRFYAMGIDAFRLALELLRARPHFERLDGVTGEIRLERDHYFTREMLPAQMVQGTARRWVEPTPPAKP